MMSDMNLRTNLDDNFLRSNGNLEDNLQAELELILREQRSRDIIDKDRDFNIYRSGSAPPTVEGSLSAVGSLFRNSDFREVNTSTTNNINGVLSEDEIRSHPAYLSYYYSHDNINPRLPPPLLSKEDWRVSQRFRAAPSSFEGIGDWKNKKLVSDGGGSSSLFSMQPGLSAQQAENDLMELRKAAERDHSRQTSAEWLDRGSDGFIGLSGTGLGARRKSFADIVQEGLDRPAYSSGHLSRPGSRNHNTFVDVMDTAGNTDSQPAELCNELEGLRSGASSSGLLRCHNIGTMGSHSFAPVVGSSLSRSTTPEPQLVGRSPGSGLPPVGSRVFPVERKNVVASNFQNGLPSGMNELVDIAATLSGLTLSNNRHLDEDSYVQSQLQVELDNKPDILFNMPNGHSQMLQQQLIDKSKAEKLAASANYIDLARKNGIVADVNASNIGFDGQVNFPKRTSSSANLYSKVNSSGSASFEGSNVHYRNADTSSVNYTGHVPNAYSVNEKINSVMNNHLDSGSALTGSAEGRGLNRSRNHVGPDLQSSVMDPRFVQYLQRNLDYTTGASASPNDTSSARNNMGSSHGDLLGFQKAYLEAILAQQKQQYELSFLGKSGGLNQGYYGNPSYGLGMPHPGNAIANSVLPSVGSGSSMFQNERVSRFTSMMRSSMGGSIGPWNPDVGTNLEGRFGSSLLEEFKNNKTRSFELSDIGDHVVEFSTDQYGSRFIQQKLETATEEEKTKIFPEITPHARTLMTDVFGNYVIQKFFEHGTENQRKELASQITGHVLPLSLQMYGCRVIQKALEVVDVDQKTQMVAELDGSIMKCVHDQNGNHVIQKCIECVPQDRIQFIITSFYGQVVALSTHPYGCRVIQRVLEHCDDLNTQQIIMDEIMESVCTLAQDQYGNYVIQHVLQHGRLHERSAIISKLAGQIVKMSQQKFASNVIEKCLTFGGPEERQLLVDEMLGTTDENEPLQAMMKDPFGNYVVQKVLEICDDQSLELIVSRIKVHLNALKRYTYGKHIVSRVEKLIATGERRIGLSSSLSS